MCGIAGLIGPCEPHRGRQAVHAMTDSLAWRGPDAEGFACWPGAILGHRRLSIFDLSELGNQPMLSADRQVGVVFNGAIYNFLELRRELEQEGCEFRSRSDTEVLVHGYRRWGIETMLPKLRGMFAIGIWDAAKRKLYLVRDRLGVKPLLYAIQGATLAFASTARALRDAGYATEIDEDSVMEFLEFGYVTDDRCIYRGVQKAPAGGRLNGATANCASPHIGNCRGPASVRAFLSVTRWNKPSLCFWNPSSCGWRLTSKWARCSARAWIPVWCAGPSPNWGATSAPSPSARPTIRWMNRATQPSRRGPWESRTGSSPWRRATRPTWGNWSRLMESPSPAPRPWACCASVKR